MVFRDAQIASTMNALAFKEASGDRAESKRRAESAAEAEAKLANEGQSSVSFHALVAAQDGGSDVGAMRVFAASPAFLPKVCHLGQGLPCASKCLMRVAAVMKI